MAPRNPLAKITETVAAVRKDPKDAAARLAGQAREAVSHGASAATRAAGRVSERATTALASRWGRKSSPPASTVASAPPVAKEQASGPLTQEPESPTEIATKEGAAPPEDVPTPAEVAERVSKKSPAKKAPAKKAPAKKAPATRTAAPRSAAKSTPSAKLPPRKPVDETDGEPDKG